MLVAGWATLSGCLPPSQATLDEEKEPHFLEGKSRVNLMDYAGAEDSFEKSLEANPRSASAHFELACLADQRESDPATAIYHYNHYLKLRPNGEKAERARTRIGACKQELARTVSLAPLTQGLQRESDQIAEENKRLKEELERWRSYYNAASAQSNRSAASLVVRPGRTNRLAIDLENPQTGAQRGPAHSVRSNPASNSTELARAGDASAAARTHIVRTGETPAAIARRYGLRVDALMAANPGLDARHLQVGRGLNIPSP